MPYVHAFVVPEPRALYDALHAEFRRYPTPEMVLHLARPVPFDLAGLIVPAAGIDA